jgi:hypothetical protein
MYSDLILPAFQDEFANHSGMMLPWWVAPLLVQLGSIVSADVV